TSRGPRAHAGARPVLRAEPPRKRGGSAPGTGGGERLGEGGEARGGGFEGLELLGEGEADLAHALGAVGVEARAGNGGHADVAEGWVADGGVVGPGVERVGVAHDVVGAAGRA